MDPLTAAVLLGAAFVWLTRDSWRAMGRAYRANQGKGGSEVAWWGRELGGVFPHFRREFADGWRAHRLSATQRKASALGGKASHRPRMTELKEEIADHKRRMAEARHQQQTPATGSPPGDQMPADSVTQTAGRPHGRRHSQTPATGQTQTGDHDPMACKNPDCECHKRTANSPGGGQPAAPGPAGNGQSTNGSSSGGTMPTGTGTSTTTVDTDYEGAQATFDAIKGLADSIDIKGPLDQAGQYADALPKMIPTDAETPSHMADAMSHLQQAEAHRQAAAEAASAGKDTLTRNHGAQHEAVQTTGHDAEIGFHGVSA